MGAVSCLVGHCTTKVLVALRVLNTRVDLYYYAEARFLLDSFKVAIV